MTVTSTCRRKNVTSPGRSNHLLTLKKVVFTSKDAFESGTCERPPPHAPRLFARVARTVCSSDRPRNLERHAASRNDRTGLRLSRAVHLRLCGTPTSRSAPIDGQAASCVRPPPYSPRGCSGGLASVGHRLWSRTGRCGGRLEFERRGPRGSQLRDFGSQNFSRRGEGESHRVGVAA